MAYRLTTYKRGVVSESVTTLDSRLHFGYIPHESNLALRDAVRVMPGGRGECGARGRGLISSAPGRLGHLPPTTIGA